MNTVGQLNEFVELIKNAKKIGVFTHILPDGDAIGSSCAFALLLKTLGKDAKVYLQNTLQEEYKYFDTKELISYDKPKDLDLVIATDCANIDRLGEYSRYFKIYDNSIAVDHHKTFINFAKCNFVSPTSSSACEYLVDIFDKCGFAINKDIASYLYLGIIRDTGGFMYNCTSAHTFEVVGKLFSFDIDYENMNRHFMMSRSYKQTLLLKVVLNNLLLSHFGKVAISTISQYDLKKNNAKVEDTGGLISQLLAIDSVEVAVLITESSIGVHKISFRSKYDVDVSKIAGVFGGGGHQKASGCQIFGKREKVVYEINKAIDKGLNN